MAAELGKFSQIGKDLGLEGSDLRNFVKEQQEFETQKLNSEAERAKSDSMLQKEILQLKIKEEEIKKENLSKEVELIQLRGSNNESQNTENRSAFPRAKMPQLHMFNPRTEKIESFLKLFSRWFEVMQFPSDKKAIVLASYLSGECLETYHRLSEEDAKSYDKLEEALLLKYDVTAEKCRADFRYIALKENENFVQLKTRMLGLLDRWIHAENKEHTFDDLREMIIKDNLMKVFPPDIRTFVKENGLKTSEEYVKAATSFAEARRKSVNFTFPQTAQGGAKRHGGTNPSEQSKYGQYKQTYSQPKPEKYCYTCQKPHDHRTCPVAQSKKTFQKGQTFKNKSDSQGQKR